MRRFWAAALFVVIAVGASAQAPPMSAREIFYGKGRASVKAATTSRQRKTPDRPTTPESPTPPAVESASGQRRNDSAQFQTVGLKSLGLRYTILKRQAAGEYVEVDGDTNFSEGDQLRLELEPNESGYLYVVNQGSSQRWSVLYPRGAEKGSNHVEAGQKYSIPAQPSMAAEAKAFTITSPGGVEKLFVILSRNPEPDIENLIYKLSDGKPSGAGPPPSLLAQNTIPIQDDMVQRLRKTYSRDLIIEKVDDSKASAPAESSSSHSPKRPPVTGEKAVYIVNPDPIKSTVVADIELRHQ